MKTNLEWQQLAVKKLSDAQAAGLTGACVISSADSWDYATQTSTQTTQTVQALRSDFKASQFNGQLIQVNDYRLLMAYSLITVPINVGSTELTFGGESLQVINRTLDPANALLILQVRRK